MERKAPVASFSFTFIMDRFCKMHTFVVRSVTGNFDTLLRLHYVALRLAIWLLVIGVLVNRGMLVILFTIYGLGSRLDPCLLYLGFSLWS